ncbi:uncharacterized protein B0H64DRAFT_409115 [Chaetomium fimeti]|uniref:Uncharacterized protein n=1 Tax=Chaetomium fimeti TaxID=1854472 RepID=A0AAE0H7N0_9PEZI|nr:hypothetical protein B0H64DRAFT_409115 [Chaetomium fimeti]
MNATPYLALVSRESWGGAGPPTATNSTTRSSGIFGSQTQSAFILKSGVCFRALQLSLWKNACSTRHIAGRLAPLMIDGRHQTAGHEPGSVRGRTPTDPLLPGVTELLVAARVTTTKPTALAVANLKHQQSSASISSSWCHPNQNSNHAHECTLNGDQIKARAGAKVCGAEYRNNTSTVRSESEQRTSSAMRPVWQTTTDNRHRHS